MAIKSTPVVRGPWMIVSLGMALLFLACGAPQGTTTTTPATPVPTQTAALRLAEGAVEVRDKEKGWVPVGAETTFELVGELESSDPWMVTGNTFAVRDLTQIAEGLEAGDPVQVKGVILEDATWLAEFIEPLEEELDPGITLTGKVNSTQPWVVSGITLEVSDDTILTGKIEPHMIVRVEILLLEEGVWEVLSIAPLSSFTEIPGCATVTAVVAGVSGEEVQFAGWPSIRLPENVKIENEAGNETVLGANRPVLVVVCPAENEQFTITKIIVLRKSEGASGAEKVLVCHKPEKNGGHTLSVSSAAVPAHLRHGDKLGRCP